MTLYFTAARVYRCKGCFSSPLRSGTRRFKDTCRIETTRLQSYDYALPGWYHVVICTKDRACFFGDIRHGIMGLSEVGCTAHRCCAAIPNHFDRAVVDAFVVMPNHVHVIVGSLPMQAGENAPVETLHATSLRPNKHQTMSDIFPDPGSLSAVVRSYKSAVTRWARRNGHPGFAWQPRFYDRVIRNEREWQATRRYVIENPVRWIDDRNHPDRQR